MKNIVDLKVVLFLASPTAFNPREKIFKLKVFISWGEKKYDTLKHQKPQGKEKQFIVLKSTVVPAKKEVIRGGTNGQQVDLERCRSQKSKASDSPKALKVNVSFVSYVNLRVAQCIFISSSS